MKRNFLVLAILLMTLTVHAQCEGMAYIDMKKVIENHPSFEVQMMKLDSLQQAYSHELQSETQRLLSRMNTLLDKYDVQQGESIDSLRTRLEASDTLAFSLLLEDNERLQEKTQRYNATLKGSEDIMITSIKKDIDVALQGYCEEEEIFMVHQSNDSSQNVAYVHQSCDITNDIIEILNN